VKVPQWTVNEITLQKNTYEIPNIMSSFPSHPLPLNEDYSKEFFPNNINNWKFKNVQKDQCKGQITEEERFEGIKSFQSGITPGLDGIPVEVYQAPIVRLF
jgi:hypothetical protein